MKLFLTSQWLLPEFHDAFTQLVGKPLDQIRVVLIENGADDEEGEPRWVVKARASLTDAGMHVQCVDLRNFVGHKNHDELRSLLGACDVVWVGGGNTYYLNWILRDSGARELITERVAGGTVYAGASAGAIVAGPSIMGYEEAGDASFAPELVPDGMRLTGIAVVPHWGRSDYGAAMRFAKEKLAADGHYTQPLADNQALVISGDQQRVIPEGEEQ